MLTNKLLYDRAHLLQKVRSFFDTKKILEVDCPHLLSKASIDTHIDLIEAEGRFLHSSPEYCMKRLLADGAPDIYQLSHVYRKGEESLKHNPEFMMAEWYRKGFSYEEMIEETADFIRLFLGPLPLRTLSYRQAFQQYLQIDSTTATAEELFAALQKHGVEPYPYILEEGKDALLNQLLGLFIEPFLGENELLALTYYPASQAALAISTTIDGEKVAKRFEIYYKGMELANGYQELADPQEQRKRLEEANHARIRLKKEALPIDEAFLNALSYLPPCCGVAVGFDRLFMLRQHLKTIETALPFAWSEC